LLSFCGYLDPDQAANGLKGRAPLMTGFALSPIGGVWLKDGGDPLDNNDFATN
jgi:hypothetical protein